MGVQEVSDYLRATLVLDRPTLYHTGRRRTGLVRNTTKVEVRPLPLEDPDTRFTL